MFSACKAGGAIAWGIALGMLKGYRSLKGCKKLELDTASGSLTGCNIFIIVPGAMPQAVALPAFQAELKRF